MIGSVEKLRYFSWALKQSLFNPSLRCPSCGNTNSVQLYRKAIVTRLFECPVCKLRFRVPQDDVNESTDFYQNRYQQGFTTDCPTDKALNELLEKKFHGTEKDYQTYIDVLSAIGLNQGTMLLDYGCSWGYGSWQLRQAGFNVYSYEISRPRAEYARTKLQCQMVDNLQMLSRKVDCFFSAHVIEHLPDPSLIWQAACNVLKPGGIFVCFTPNGEPTLEKIYGTKRYHKLWGQVHPLLLSKQALTYSAHHYGFTSYIYSSPYDYMRIQRSKTDEKPVGNELLLIAVRND